MGVLRMGEGGVGRSWCGMESIKYEYGGMSEKYVGRGQRKGGGLGKLEMSTKCVCVVGIFGEKVQSLQLKMGRFDYLLPYPMTT